MLQQRGCVPAYICHWYACSHYVNAHVTYIFLLDSIWEWIGGVSCWKRTLYVVVRAVENLAIIPYFSCSTVYSVLAVYHCVSQNRSHHSLQYIKCYCAELMVHPSSVSVPLCRSSSQQWGTCTWRTAKASPWYTPSQHSPPSTTSRTWENRFYA